MQQGIFCKIFAVSPQKSCTFPTSILILVGKNTVYNACILQERLRKAVFEDPNSKAVGTSRYSDLFSRHYIEFILPEKAYGDRLRERIS